MKRSPVTARGAKMLREELSRLKTKERPRIIQAIAEARAHGDLKENAEYHAAKEEQGKMEARIRQLKHLLDTATIGTPPTDQGAAPGLVVTIERDGAEKTYLLGSREDEHPEHRVLSADSPIGKAIVGATVGETRKATLPNGTPVEVTVTAIEPA